MITAVASQKGGTGKTSTSISLSAGLARKGKKILLVDLDSQSNSSKVLAPNYADLKKEDTIYTTIIDKNPLPVIKTAVKNLDLVPSHILLSNADIELTTAIDHREQRLQVQLDVIKNKYDYIFIDCPPNLGWLTLNGLTAAEKVLVVVSPGYFELDSVVQLSKTLERVKTLFNSDIELLGFLFTMSDPTINSKTSLKILRQTYTDDVLKTVIPRNVDIKDAHFNKIDIFKFNPHSKAAEAYNKLIEEVFNG